MGMYQIRLSGLLCSILGALIFADAHAAAERSFFVVGTPITLADLPVGPAKNRLLSLSPTAQNKALAWLSEFSFPVHDLEHLRFDDEGGVFYLDAHLPPASAISTDVADTPVVAQATLADTFKLHSKPGSSRVLYLDFDGHQITGTAWNSGTASTLYAKPFDIDNNPAFNSDELTRIQEIWHRVAEDYAPFDIDVTTELPTSFGPTVGRVLITPSTDAKGVLMPYGTAGGVAYINAFGRSDYAYYSPALVYADRLSYAATYVSEAASHEFGHNLGLSHDGMTTQAGESYYKGHGSGLVSWGPIMGANYYSNVTQWSKGEYATANNPENDLAIISGKLPYRTDDHGDLFNSATRLLSATDGSVQSVLPIDETGTTLSQNKGVIASDADKDVFYMEVGAGTIDLTVKPAWASFYRTSLRGANLDVAAALYDNNGTLLTQSDPLDDTFARVTATVPGGLYYLVVQGVGNSVSPYSGYASIGQYFISGQTPAVVASTPPAAPLGLSATAINHAQVNLTWLDQAANEAGFYVERTDASGSWQRLQTLAANSTSFQDNSVSASTRYSYRIVAFNSAGSAVSSVVTVDVPAQLLPPVAPTIGSASNSAGKVTVSWRDNSNNETGFEIKREALKKGRTTSWQTATLQGTTGANVISWSESSGSGTFRYAVRALNQAGASAWSAWTNQVTVSSTKTTGVKK